jgi:hypothetical protein
MYKGIPEEILMWYICLNDSVSALPSGVLQGLLHGSVTDGFLLVSPNVASLHHSYFKHCCLRHLDTPCTTFQELALLTSSGDYFTL